MNKTNVLIYELTFLLLILSIPVFTSVKGSPTFAAVDPSFKKVIIGNSFTLDLNVSDVTDLYLWVVTIEWDDSIIEFQSYEEGPFLKAAGSTAIMDAGVSSGKVDKLVCTVLSPVSGVSGEGSLVTFTFNAVALGTTPVSITFSDLLNSNGEHISHDIYDGVVQVSSPPEHYELTVTSSPITGIQFTLDGTPQTTPYTEWLPEGYYTLEMPETHDGYEWSHWFEDGDTDRTKTIHLQGTTWTGVYLSTGPPRPPIGGFWIPIDELKLLAPWIGLASLITVAAASIIYVRHRKKQQN